MNPDTLALYAGVAALAYHYAGLFGAGVVLTAIGLLGMLLAGLLEPPGRQAR